MLRYLLIIIILFITVRSLGEHIKSHRVELSSHWSLEVKGIESSCCVRLPSASCVIVHYDNSCTSFSEIGHHD